VQSAVGSAPRGEGQGRASVSVRPGLCLRELVCPMAKVAAGGDRSACTRCFLAPGSQPGRRLLRSGRLPPPFPSTDEGADGQAVMGRSGSAAAARGLLLWGRLVASSKGTRAWGLRTISLRHLWSLAEAESSSGPVSLRPDGVPWTPRETSQRHARLPPRLCQESSSIEKGLRWPRKGVRGLPVHPRRVQLLPRSCTGPGCGSSDTRHPSTCSEAEGLAHPP